MCIRDSTNGTYSAPAGLSINSLSGTINFTTSTPGTYTVTYTIPASGGCAAVPVITSVSFGTPPVITTNLPADTGSCINNNITFISAASGTPAPAVQWQVSTDAGATWGNISG